MVRAYPDQGRDTLAIAVEVSRPLVGTQDFAKLLPFDTAASNEESSCTLDAGGKNVTSGALIVEGTNVTSQLDDNLPRGTYSVYYRTSGSDGKPRGGAFQFAYGPGQWTPLDKEVWVGEAEEPPILKNPDPNETGPGEPSETSTATPTSAPPETPSATPSPEPTVTAEPSESPAATPDEGGDSPAGWLVGAGVAAAVLAGWDGRGRSHIHS